MRAEKEVVRLNVKLRRFDVSDLKRSLLEGA